MTDYKVPLSMFFIVLSYLSKTLLCCLTMLRIDCVGCVYVIVEQTWFMINFKAHNLFVIDCNVKAEKTWWLMISFRAHELLVIDCHVIVEQTWLVICFEAQNLLRIDCNVIAEQVLHIASCIQYPCYL